MAIDLQVLFEDKARRYATSGNGNDRFVADFQAAMRDACSKVFIRLNLDTALPTDQSDSVDLDEKLETVLSAFIDAYLAAQGQKLDLDDNYTTLLSRMEDRVKEAEGYLAMYTVNQNQDDDEEDVVGLGYKAGH